MKYRTIVADPPWRYRSTLPPFLDAKRDAHLMAIRGQESRADAARSITPYPTMSVAEITALPIGTLAEPNAHLYLWTTSTHLQHAFGIVEAWGFTYSTLLVWCKPPRGAAGFPTYAIRTEYVLFCRRGSLPAKERINRNWWQWPRGAHSAKPEHFQDLVEQVSPGPYLELFARRQRLGWSVLGNAINGQDIRDAMQEAA